MPIPIIRYQFVIAHRFQLTPQLLFNKIGINIRRFAFLINCVGLSKSLGEIGDTTDNRTFWSKWPCHTSISSLVSPMVIIATIVYILFFNWIMDK